MTSISVRIDHRDPGHVHFAVFAGVDADHRAKAGDLILTPTEFDDFCARLRPDKVTDRTADEGRDPLEVLGLMPGPIAQAAAGDGRGRYRRTPEQAAAISLGIRRSRWANRQALLAREGKVHDLVPVTRRLSLPGGVADVGDCHWCVFWGVNPGHTGAGFE
jgi:hypothetical protein